MVVLVDEEADYHNRDPALAQPEFVGQSAVVRLIDSVSVGDLVADFVGAVVEAEVVKKTDLRAEVMTAVISRLRFVSRTAGGTMLLWRVEY